MKKNIIFLFLCLMTLNLFASCSSDEPKQQEETSETVSGRILVAYFSWSNNTKALAEVIQQLTNADIYRIEPREPYTTDYNTLAYTISLQEKESNARPALKDTLATLNDYDIIFVGCPVWWYDAPMIIHSFLECESYDFKGKTIIPFCTYYTGTSQTLNDIVRATPDSKHLEGLGIQGAASYNINTIKAWLDRIGVSDIVSGITTIESATATKTASYSLDGKRMAKVSSSSNLYISKGKKYLNEKQ
ncbi:MAG: flavodoxin [Prevotella sp.]